MTLLRGIVLDLDGLLIDSEVWSWQAHDAVLQAFDREPLSLHEVRRLVGLAGRDEWHVLQTMRDVNVQFHEYAEAHTAAYLRIRPDDMAPMTGVLELIDTAAALGLRLALASNSGLSSIRDTLESLGILASFDAIASGTEVPSGKPAPDVYTLALQRMDVTSGEAIAIEDSTVGIRAAVAAGLRCLAVPNLVTAAQDFSQAFRQFATLADAAAWLRAEYAPA